MTFFGTNLALIVGHYKAGSSWLLRLLCLHPEIRGLAETHIFHHIQRQHNLSACSSVLFNSVPWSGGGPTRWPIHHAQRLAGAVLGRGAGRLALCDRPATLLDLTPLQAVRLRQSIGRCGTHEEYCRVFFGRLYEYLRSPQYLLEKTPRNIRYVPFIKAIFPHAKLLAIYRDGRDVCVSDKFFRARRGEAWSIEDSVTRWREAMDAQNKYKALYDLHAISYEALQTDSERTVTGVLDFLGLDKSPALVRRLISGASFESVTGRRRGAENRSSFNRKGVVGDWRNNFTASDRDIFKTLANDLLLELNYENDADW
jgi:hypothetical protein